MLRIQSPGRRGRHVRRRHRALARQHPFATLVLVLLLPGLLAVPIAHAIGAEDAGALPESSGNSYGPASGDGGPKQAPSGSSEPSYGPASGDGGPGSSPGAPSASPSDGSSGGQSDQSRKKNGEQTSPPGGVYGPSSGDGGPKAPPGGDQPPVTPDIRAAHGGAPLELDDALRKARDWRAGWNQKGGRGDLRLRVWTRADAEAILETLQESAEFKFFPVVPPTLDPSQPRGRIHWDDVYEDNGRLKAHPNSIHGTEPHLQVDARDGQLQVFFYDWEHSRAPFSWGAKRQRYTLLDPEPAQPLTQPASPPDEAKSPPVLTTPGTQDPALQNPSLVDAGEAAGRELLDEIDKDGGGFTLSEPSAGPTTPGVNVVPPESQPLLEVTSVLATTSTQRVTPEASAPPTGPATALEMTIDTYLRPAVTALEPYVGTAVATVVVAGAVVVGWLAWRAATSCGGPCAFRPSVA